MTPRPQGPAARIVYTDGSEWIGALHTWRNARADGVDLVEIGTEKFHGHALYWAYYDERDQGAWIFGMASTYESPPPPEYLLRADGSIRCARSIVTIPDLYHADVKIGWWRRPPEGKSYVPGRIE